MAYKKPSFSLVGCENCKFWVRGTLHRYTTSERTDVLETDRGRPCANPDSPICGTVVPANFACPFEEAKEPDDQQLTVVTHDGEAWQFWTMVPCPDCKGVGNMGGFDSASCHRCAGTGNVRRYDDGYLGDEQLREHPRERDVRMARIRNEELAKAQALIAAAAAPPAPVAPEQVPSS